MPKTETPAEEVTTQTIVTPEAIQSRYDSFDPAIKAMLAGVNETVANHNKLVAAISASEPKNLESALDGIVEESEDADLSQLRVQIAQIKDLLDEAIGKARTKAMEFLPSAMNDEEKKAAQEQVKALRTAAGKSVDVIDFLPQMFPTMVNADDVEFIKTHLVKPLKVNGRTRSANSISGDGPGTGSQRPRVQDVLINGERVNGDPKLDKDTKLPLKDDETGEILTHSRFSDASKYVAKNFGVSIAVSEFPQLFQRKNNVSSWDSVPESDTLEYTGTNKNGESVSFTIGYVKAVG